MRECCRRRPASDLWKWFNGLESPGKRHRTPSHHYANTAKISPLARHGCHGIAHCGLEAPVPTGQDLSGRCDAPALGLMQPSASDPSLLDGVMEPRHIDALAPVEGAKHLDRAICLHPPGLTGVTTEALLTVLLSSKTVWSFCDRLVMGQFGLHWRLSTRIA